MLTVFGYLDDRFDLDPRIKFLGQFIAAGIVILGGDIQIHSVTLDDRMFLPAWISIPLTFLFLVGITNAINLADGLDGLAGGTTFLCLCALAILAYHSGQLLVRGARAGLCGSDPRVPALQHLSGEHLHGRCRQSAARASRSGC